MFRFGDVSVLSCMCNVGLLVGRLVVLISIMCLCVSGVRVWISDWLGLIRVIGMLRI